MPLVDLQLVNVAFPDHTHLLLLFVHMFNGYINIDGVYNVLYSVKTSLVYKLDEFVISSALQRSCTKRWWV